MIRCPLQPPSMTLDRGRPEILTPPEHPQAYDARPHRSLGQPTPAQADTHPPEPVNLTEFRIRRKQVLGGLIHEYYAAA
jgi:hypothetical protein